MLCFLAVIQLGVNESLTAAVEEEKGVAPCVTGSCSLSVAAGSMLE